MIVGKMPDDNMDMKIVYLGWGSLLWDYGTLGIKGNWKEAQELELPLEFSRISDLGRGRLTLVIDNYGKANQIWYAKAATENVNEAISNLRIREKTKKDNIAYINLYLNRSRINNTHPRIAARIEKWARTVGVDAVIWTDLPSNFKEMTGMNFTPSNAYKYFKMSSTDVRIKIVEYMYRASKIAGITTKFSIYFFNHLLNGTI